MDYKMIIIKNVSVLVGGLMAWFFVLMFVTTIIAYLTKKHSNDLEFNWLFVGARNCYHYLTVAVIVYAIYWVNWGT